MICKQWLIHQPFTSQIHDRGQTPGPTPPFSRSPISRQTFHTSKGKTAAVIAWVGEIMKPVFKPQDYEKTATRAKELRWQNTTRWARQRMVEDGRLKPDSPNGLWETSAQGRAWLK